MPTLTVANLQLFLTVSLHPVYGFSWWEIMVAYLSADIICSEKQTVFRELSSRETMVFEEQIMSKDKYPNIL